MQDITLRQTDLESTGCAVPAAKSVTSRLKSPQHHRSDAGVPKSRTRNTVSSQDIVRFIDQTTYDALGPDTTVSYPFEQVVRLNFCFGGSKTVFCEPGTTCRVESPLGRPGPGEEGSRHALITLRLGTRNIDLGLVTMQEDQDQKGKWFFIIDCRQDTLLYQFCARYVNCARLQQQKRWIQMSIFYCEGTPILEHLPVIAPPAEQRRARVGYWALRHRLPKRVFAKSNVLQSVFKSTIVRYPVVQLAALSTKMQKTQRPDAKPSLDDGTALRAAHYNQESATF